MHGQQQPRTVVQRPAADIDHHRAGVTCRLKAGHCIYRWVDRAGRQVRCARCGHQRKTQQLDPACCRRICSGLAGVRTIRRIVPTVVPLRTARGLGDTIAWLIGLVSFGRLKAKPGCGCHKRQARLNRWWPYQR